MKTKILILLSSAVILSACAVQPREMPGRDATGSDKMRISPCVCIDLNYQAPQLKEGDFNA